MLVVQDAYHATDLPRGAVATIGNFDGLHLGQRAVVDQVVARARALGVPSVLLTFDPHPLAVLRPAETPPRITTAEQKERLLAETGLDFALVLTFNQELARTSARSFTVDFLAGRLAVLELHVGADFVFGQGRDGNVELLRELGATLGFAVSGVAEVVVGGARVSSSRIRRALAEGRVEEAMALLGRPSAITGTVRRGDRMGKRLGWPTINLVVDNELLPGDGVYACRVSFPSFPATFDAATNIGTRPTVYENYQRVVEAHVLDFATDVYGERVELAFFKRLRDERVFPSVMDLSAQIRHDVQITREFFAVLSSLENQAEAAVLPWPAVVHRRIHE